MRGTVKGNWRDGDARILEPGAEADRAQHLLTRKHGLLKRVTDWWYQRNHGKAVVLAIDLKAPVIASRQRLPQVDSSSAAEQPPQEA